MGSPKYSGHRDRNVYIPNKTHENRKHIFLDIRFYLAEPQSSVSSDPRYLMEEYFQSPVKPTIITMSSLLVGENPVPHDLNTWLCKPIPSVPYIVESDINHSHTHDSHLWFNRMTIFFNVERRNRNCIFQDISPDVAATIEPTAVPCQVTQIAIPILVMKYQY